MWTDQDLDEFMKTKYPEYYPMYIGYDANIKRIDAARYFILLEYGGIYADMDFECVKNFENLLPPDKVSIAESAFEGEVFQNALMVSPRSHPFWYSVIRELESYKHHPHPHHATGPQVLVRAYDENSVHSLPAAQFAVVTDPYYIAKKETLNRADQNVYAAHHGTCSWCQ
jgi:mannosyltransferase OCH1-like enzyme